MFYPLCGRVCFLILPDISFLCLYFLTNVSLFSFLPSASFIPRVANPSPRRFLFLFLSSFFFILFPPQNFPLVPQPKLGCDNVAFNDIAGKAWEYAFRLQTATTGLAESFEYFLLFELLLFIFTSLFFLQLT